MDWLTTRPTPDVANHWFALLSLALFAILVIAAGVMSTRPGLPPFNGKNTQKFVSVACGSIGWIAGAGLFFHIIRLLQIDPGTLGRPIWIVLCWIALIAVAGWLVYTSPQDRANRKANEQRNRGTRAPAKSTGQKTARAK